MVRCATTVLVSSCTSPICLKGPRVQSGGMPLGTGLQVPKRVVGESVARAGGLLFAPAGALG